VTTIMKRPLPASILETTEGRRLAAPNGATWRRWGPYLSERQWGTVREDYSPRVDAWDYLSHDQARSRAYRWGEDGIGGFGDERLRICLAVALWNGGDPILKERLLGLTNSEGNHGEVSIACEVTNRGPTQDALDGINGAIVRITSLRPGSPSGPGIEFLDYPAPSTGRRAQSDAASNDLVHAHLVLCVDHLKPQVRRLWDNHAHFVSPGIVHLGDGIDAAMVRDPDGHLLLLEELANGQ
jgi:hypothetical protein